MEVQARSITMFSTLESFSGKKLKISVWNSTETNAIETVHFLNVRRNSCLFESRPCIFHLKILTCQASDGYGALESSCSPWFFCWLHGLLNTWAPRQSLSSQWPHQAYAGFWPFL